MTRLDERLRRELERAGRPADPTGVYEHLIRRRERRRIVRRVEAGVLALAVSVGSAVGIWALTRGAQGGTPATPGPGSEIAAALSDGRLVLISAEDGSVRSTIPAGQLSSPMIHEPLAWSPDGDTLAVGYVGQPTQPDLGPPGIYVVPGDGGEATLLYGTERANGDILVVSDIAWSPDGRRIAFAVEGAFRWLDAGAITEVGVAPAIYTIDADGSDLQRLPFEAPVSELAWSPDGSALAVTEASQEGQDIFLLDLTAGTEIRLTDDGQASSPAWSPDGSRIAFVSGPPRYRRLFVVNADGTGLRRLTDPDGSDASPTWSPDREWIAVTRRLPTFTGPSGALGPSGIADASGPLGGETCQVVLVRADGSEQRVLVDGPIDGACPVELAWRPAPSTGITGEPTTGTTTSHAPTASPASTPTVSPAAVPDLLAGCGLSALQADYDGDGTTDVAVVATLPRDGGCPEPGKGETYLGIGFGQTEQDVGAGSFRADVTFGPLDCGAGVGCRVFAAPDLDGDGAAELALVQDAGANAEILGLYRVGFCGPAENCVTASWISPIEVAQPGDPALDLAPGPARILWGGSVLESSGAYCGAMEGNPPTDETGFVVWRASASSGSSGPTVHEALFQVRQDRLALVATHDYDAPSTAAGLPPGGGSDLCGAPVAGSSGD